MFKNERRDFRRLMTAYDEKILISAAQDESLQAKVALIKATLNVQRAEKRLGLR